MSDIVKFLRDRLDEDEAEAREASVFYDDHDAYENGVSWRGHEGKTESGSTCFWLVPHLGVIYDPASGRHIVRHNPARVLAEVVAKRKIVMEYATALHLPDAVFAGTERSAGFQLALEMACRALAVPYAEHPDYDPAWRVE